MLPTAPQRKGRVKVARSYWGFSWGPRRRASRSVPPDLHLEQLKCRNTQLAINWRDGGPLNFKGLLSTRAFKSIPPADRLTTCSYLSGEEANSCRSRKPLGCSASQWWRRKQQKKQKASCLAILPCHFPSLPFATMAGWGKGHPTGEAAAEAKGLLLSCSALPLSSLPLLMQLSKRGNSHSEAVFGHLKR